MDPSFVHGRARPTKCVNALLEAVQRLCETGGVGLRLLICFAAAAAACQSDPATELVPSADTQLFRDEAYPVLMRDCGFNACHGAPERFLVIFGPNRARIDPTTHHDTPVQPLELEVTHERARSMLITDGPVTCSLLLTKPLEKSEGGVSHGGVDDFERNVYQSVTDPGYVTLLKWAQAVVTAAPPSALPTEPTAPAPAGTTLPSTSP